MGHNSVLFFSLLAAWRMKGMNTFTEVDKVSSKELFDCDG